MPKFEAYTVTVGTEPGVYLDWQECAYRVINVKGSIYKGYRTRWEAREAYEAAIREGRVKVIRVDTPQAPPGGVPPGARPPPAPSNPTSPRRAPGAAPAGHAAVPIHVPPPQASAPLPRPQRRASASSGGQGPAVARAARTLPAATPPRTMHSPPGPAPVSRSSSSPNIMRPGPDPSPRRSAQTTVPSPLGRAVRSPAAPLTSPFSAAPRPRLQTLAELSPAPVRPRDASPASERGDNWSPTTDVTYVEPGGSGEEAEAARSPARVRDRTPARSPAPSVSRTASASVAGRASSTSSPSTGVTHVEPDLPDIANMSISRNASRQASPAPSSQRSSQRSLTRSRLRDGVQYADVEVQTPRTRERERLQSTPGTPAGPPHRVRSPGSGLGRTQSDSQAELRYYLLSSAPGSPAASPSRSNSNPRRVAGSRLQSPAPSQGPLSPLGLSLSQPLHTPGVVYPAAADPRSPIQRSTSVPSNSPVFHRPSPQSTSLTNALFGA